MTKREEFETALTALGERRVEYRSSKYRVWTATPGKSIRGIEVGRRFWFLGKSGAVRLGRTVSESHSVGDLFRRAVLSKRYAAEEGGES